MAFAQRVAAAYEALAGWALAHVASAGMAALVHLVTLPNRPVLDDGWAVLDNPLVRRLDVRRIFEAEYGYAGGGTLAGPEAREKLRRAAALDPRDPEAASLLAEIGAR